MDFLLVAGSVFVLTYVPGVIARAWGVGRMRRTVRGKLILTYDDGPSPVSPTPLILEALRRHGVKATFFLLGSQALQAEAMCERLVAEGHDIGSHGFLHVHGWKHPFRAVVDLAHGIRIVSRWRRGRPIYRQPYGKSTLLTLLAAAHFKARAVWWTVDSGDTWERTPDSASILKRIERDQGGIVLMHDFPREAASERVQFTVDLTEKLLDLAAQRGWSVCTASEVLEMAAPPP